MHRLSCLSNFVRWSFPILFFPVTSTKNKSRWHAIACATDSKLTIFKILTTWSNCQNSDFFCNSIWVAKCWFYKRCRFSAQDISFCMTYHEKRICFWLIAAQWYLSTSKVMAGVSEKLLFVWPQHATFIVSIILFTASKQCVDCWSI